MIWVQHEDKPSALWTQFRPGVYGDVWPRGDRWVWTLTRDDLEVERGTATFVEMAQMLCLRAAQAL